jgi:hypothetical protein
MHFAKNKPAKLALIVILLAPLAVGARQAPAGDKPPGGAEVVPLVTSSPPGQLLPFNLAGVLATSELKEFHKDSLRDLVGETATIYQEYKVISAASREYGRVRVDVFHTQNQFAAFGLFRFIAGTAKDQAAQQELGQGSVRLNGEMAFWKGTFLVRLRDAVRPSRAASAAQEALARAIAGAIGSHSAGVTHPPLLDSLPTASIMPGTERYFLGPESLNAELKQGREMFDFVGETEAATAEYKQDRGLNGGTGQAASPNQAVGTRSGPMPGSAVSTSSSPVKLVIVECHTPEFATDEMARVSGYISSLPEIEQQQIVFKRTGNYIVAAVNVGDRDFAEGLVNSVQYPYTVKWLRNPLWPTNDPFRVQKAADMLLSTFGLLGLILLTVLMGGTVFGTTVFLKRRKQQREVFSDAGGMLRLDIEPFVLALPPKRDK